MAFRVLGVGIGKVPMFDTMKRSMSGVFMVIMLTSGVLSTIDATASFLFTNRLLLAAAFRSSDSGRFMLLVGWTWAALVTTYWPLASVKVFRLLRVSCIFILVFIGAVCEMVVYAGWWRAGYLFIKCLCSRQKEAEKAKKFLIISGGSAYERCLDMESNGFWWVSFGLVAFQKYATPN